MLNELAAPNGTVQGKKDVLVNDVKNVVDDAQALLKQVVASGAEGFAAARSTLEGQLDEAKSKLDRARNAAAGLGNRAAGSTQLYVSENPWKAIGIATAIGLIAGLALTRR